MCRGTQKTDRSLSRLLDRRFLRGAAGARSFERGEGYHEDGRVGSLAEYRGAITAKVQGTRSYRVKLWVESGEVQYSCTCPMGEDGAFCKHCVAVGLTWLEQAAADGGGRTGRKRGRRPSKRPMTRAEVTLDDVRAWLAGRDKKVLVEMLMDQALEDDRLRQRLLLEVARTRARGPDLATYRLVIDEAVDTDGFVDYRHAYDYAQGIEEAVDAVQDLLKEGRAAEVIELAEYALESVEGALGDVDDSGGNLGAILERLQEIHLKACRKARPDPEALARRLFEWEMRSDYYTFHDAVTTYARVLGKKGLAEYRKLAEAQWAKVPALGPDASNAERFGPRYRITKIMETLARQSGDVASVIAVKERDLSSAHAYLDIAQTCREARDYDAALAWAERGVKAFPERTHPPLREFLADEYHRRKRHDEAMALIWATFSERPVLESCQTLKKHATRARQWTAWRDKALAHLRPPVAGVKRARPADAFVWARRPDHTELVRVFLWEKDVEAAWRAAVEGGCSDTLWMDLATRREGEHPDEAIPIYQREIERTLNRKNNQAYQEAVKLLKKVQGLMTRTGRGDPFAQYLETVRKAHKRKRNFMKLLDRARW